MTSDRTVSRLALILGMIPHVLERGSVEVDEIMEKFGYNAAQLSRDLDTVFVCGLPGYGPGDLMEAYISDDEVIVDAADYFKRAPRLTSTEALGLLSAGLTVLGMGEEVPALESAVKKLGKALMPDAGAITIDVLDETQNVKTLRQAAAENRVVRITYRSIGKEETTEREIEPWAVAHTLGNWYVIGHCRLVDDERTFRVDRIRDLEVLDETFQPPDRKVEPTIGYSPSDGDVSCLIDLNPQAAWVMEYYPVEVVKKLKDRTRIRFWAPDPEVAARLLIRLGDTATLVEGDEVRRRLQDLGEALLERYV